MTNITDEMLTAADTAGHKAGTAAGSWVLDGNSTNETAHRILEGLEDGDPEIFDMCPSPLSGEWAGESIPELSAEYGIDLEDDILASAFEQGFADGWSAEVERSARVILGLDD